jgi:hypothetical protein
VDVGGRHLGRERDALAVDEDVVLRAGLALVGRVAADGGAPLFAGRLLESRAARVQSIRSESNRGSPRVDRIRHQYLVGCRTRGERRRTSPSA